MTKEELFKKYSIDESHNTWNLQIDNWMSIEIYRIMHGGELPDNDNTSIIWVKNFLDKQDDMQWWATNIMSRPDWGSLYLTAKRMLYKFADKLLETV
jgi:hypothetical protein